jgi:hypothetical protein
MKMPPFKARCSRFKVQSCLFLLCSLLSVQAAKLVWSYDPALVAAGAVYFEVWRSTNLDCGFESFTLWQITFTNECALSLTNASAYFICRAVNTATGQTSDWNKP